MYETGSVLENEPLRILRDFELQTDQPILIRKPDQVLIN